MKEYKIILVLAVVVFVLASCENKDITYPDFESHIVYFANQYPVRTVVLGEDLFVDNSLDNEHKVMIKATLSGARDNTGNVEIDFMVEESLCDDRYFEGTDSVKVVPMPSNYYQLATNKISITPGNILGGVEVQLTDAFFADSSSLLNTYVIPLILTDVEGADSILQGLPLVEDPNRCIETDWSVLPKDFVLYAIKYVNPWHGNYLRRGEDVVDNNGSTTTEIRHEEFEEDNEVVSISTNSLDECTLPLSVRPDGGRKIDFELILTFAEDGTCSISGNSSNIVISGTGKFVLDGEKNSFGGLDRNALYLDYTVEILNRNIDYSTKDTLVVRDRGIKPEYFSVF